MEGMHEEEVFDFFFQMPEILNRSHSHVHFVWFYWQVNYYPLLAVFKLFMASTKRKSIYGGRESERKCNMKAVPVKTYTEHWLCGVFSRKRMILLKCAQFLWWCSFFARINIGPTSVYSFSIFVVGFEFFFWPSEPYIKQVREQPKIQRTGAPLKLISLGKFHKDKPSYKKRSSPNAEFVWLCFSTIYIFSFAISGHLQGFQLFFFPSNI